MTPSLLHTIRLSAYVDLGLDDTLDVLATWPGLEAVVSDAVRAAVDDTGPTVEVETSEILRVSDAQARLTVSWSVVTPRGETAGSHAEVALLRVQSGREPMTELLLRVDVASAAVPEVAPVLRRVLDDVADRLVVAERSSRQHS